MACGKRVDKNFLKGFNWDRHAIISDIGFSLYHWRRELFFCSKRNQWVSKPKVPWHCQVSNNMVQWRFVCTKRVFDAKYDYQVPTKPNAQSTYYISYCQSRDEAIFTFTPGGTIQRKQYDNGTGYGRGSGSLWRAGIWSIRLKVIASMSGRESPSH